MIKMHIFMSMFPNYKGKCLKSQRKLSHTHTHSVVTPIKSSCSLIFLPISPLIKSNLRLPTYLCKSDPSHAKSDMPVSKATGSRASPSLAPRP